MRAFDWDPIRAEHYGQRHIRRINRPDFLAYGAAIPAYNDKPEAAVAFVKFLSALDKKDFWKTAGFELISTTY
jgi:ABC-type molybdate transport system substrate-binding protein